MIRIFLTALKTKGDNTVCQNSNKSEKYAAIFRIFAIYHPLFS